jgi:hypothetical protein
MEIEKTFIVEKGSMGNEKRFVKVYLSNNRYLLQAPQGAIKEISKDEFNNTIDVIKDKFGNKSIRRARDLLNINNKK